jgi:hypothetical protein
MQLFVDNGWLEGRKATLVFRTGANVTRPILLLLVHEGLA